HDRDPRVRAGPVVAASPPQSDRPPDQGRAAVPQGRGGRGRPLPPPMNLSKLKRWFVGTPIATAQAHHERLGPITGLAVFASDNLSSVAYATEEILRVLLLAGVGALAFSVPIGLCIGGVIGIVILSYRQNIAAYPQGASDYIVAKDNLGVFSGLTAGAALLIDYTLTVAVSVSAGVAALTSAVPVLYPYRVVLGVGLVVLVAVANLRGIRESGRVFAVWSYLFIAGYALLMVYGFTSLAIWGRPPAQVAAVPAPSPPGRWPSPGSRRSRTAPPPSGPRRCATPRPCSRSSG